MMRFLNFGRAWVIITAAKTYWLNQKVTIVGNGIQSDRYAEGLRTLGQSPRILDATHVTLAGLKSAYLQIAKDAH